VQQITGVRGRDGMSTGKSSVNIHTPTPWYRMTGAVERLRNGVMYAASTQDRGMRWIDDRKSCGTFASGAR